MKLIKILSWALVLCLLLPFTGCESSSSGAAFRYYIEEEPKNLDPQTASNASAFLVIENLFEGLMRVDEDGNLTTGVAESYTVDDSGLFYTFQLKEDLLWSNEEPVTSHDFIFAFQRLFNPETNAAQTEDFLFIKNARQALNGQASIDDIGVWAEGDYMVYFELEQPNPMFLELLSTAPAMPCLESFFDTTKGKYGITTKTIVSNGPFQINAWKTDDYVSTKKNELYRNDIEAKSVVYIVTEEDTNVIDEFNDKRNSAIILNGGEYASFDAKGLEVNTYESVTWGIGFNTNSPYFSNAELRRAFILSFLPDTLEGHLTLYNAAARSIIPPVVTFDNESYVEATNGITLPYDLDAAKSYMEQYYSDKEERTVKDIKVVIPDKQEHIEIFQAIAQIWQKELNVYFDIQTLDEEGYQQFLAGQSEAAFDMALIGLELSYNSPMDILSKFYINNPYNYFNYSSSEFENYCDLAVVEKDHMQSMSHYNEAEQLLVSNGIFLPLYYQNEYFIMAKGTSGFVYLPTRKMVQFCFGK